MKLCPLSCKVVRFNFGFCSWSILRIFVIRNNLLNDEKILRGEGGSSSKGTVHEFFKTTELIWLSQQILIIYRSHVKWCFVCLHYL